MATNKRPRKTKKCASGLPIQKGGFPCPLHQPFIEARGDDEMRRSLKAERNDELVATVLALMH